MLGHRVVDLACRIVSIVARSKWPPRSPLWNCLIASAFSTTLLPFVVAISIFGMSDPPSRSEHRIKRGLLAAAKDASSHESLHSITPHGPLFAERALQNICQRLTRP